MEFMNAFKHLEKTCNEMYGDIHGVRQYIDEMKSHPDGQIYIKGWNRDLQQLKYYNRVRNQISHEPDRTEENMCDPYDAAWIEAFHSRILSQNDPLSLYRTTTKSKYMNNNKNIQQSHTQKSTAIVPNKKPNNKPAPSNVALKVCNAVACFLIIMIIILLILIIRQFFC